jgi:ABC-type bacteriocin/lantibiotic exporter with double-glycine peptidase domain
MWQSKLEHLNPVQELDQLPSYGVLFFFRNMGPFRTAFWLLTLCRVISSLFRFAAVYLLGDIVSHVADITTSQVFSFYLPAWLGATAASEGLDFLTRKYAEAFPIIYRDHLMLRFYLSFLELDARKLFNFSKERLNALVGKYAGNVQSFLNDWVWQITGRGASFAVIVAILLLQSPVVLAINVVYMLLFLWLSLGISALFSPVAKRYAEQDLESAAVLNSFTWNLNTVKRLALNAFFLDTSRLMIGRNWARFEEVRSFHAKRWLLQLNLFNVLYIGTIVYAIYQIKAGALPLGYLVLLKWAFDELWQILVYIIEFYVNLVQQREDAALVRRHFKDLMPSGRGGEPARFELNGWKRIELEGVHARFMPQSAGDKVVEIRAPRLEIKRGDKLGIIGESGSGKSTILNVLLNLVDFEGSYRVDGAEMSGRSFDSRHVTIITNFDPLFKLSLRANILLGRKVDEARLASILKGVGVDEFARDLDAVVGGSNFNLSSGQEQRVRLARGLLQESSLYLLDEPFNGIDAARKTEIIHFLREHLRDRAVILVTHNRDELSLVEQVYELKNGELSPQTSR